MILSIPEVREIRRQQQQNNFTHPYTMKGIMCMETNSTITAPECATKTIVTSEGRSTRLATGTDRIGFVPSALKTKEFGQEIVHFRNECIERIILRLSSDRNQNK